jgi:hypothetical protein
MRFTCPACHVRTRRTAAWCVICDRRVCKGCVASTRFGTVCSDACLVTAYRRYKRNVRKLARVINAESIFILRRTRVRRSC